MVEFILTESQLNCLKAAVPFGSQEFESLEAGHRLEPNAMGQPRIAINCTAEVASSLLGMAKRFCADVIVQIRTAVEAQTHQV